MLLRVRVTLPDRPGALGQVARTLGVCGADIVQVVVLERLAGRAVDDFTVVWPSGARIERLVAGVCTVPGVQLDGVWRAAGAPVTGGHDAELLGQVAANPDDGLSTLVDAVPGLLAADWAAVLVVAADWAVRGTSEPAPAYVSWRAPMPLQVPDVTPLRPRALDGPDGIRYAAAPFGRNGLVLVVARVDGDGLPAAAFHVTEVERVAQVVRAVGIVLGDRLDLVAAPPTDGDGIAHPLVVPASSKS